METIYIVSAKKVCNYIYVYINIYIVQLRRRKQQFEFFFLLFWALNNRKMRNCDTAMLDFVVHSLSTDLGLLLGNVFLVCLKLIQS